MQVSQALGSQPASQNRPCRHHHGRHSPGAAARSSPDWCVRRGRRDALSVPVPLTSSFTLSVPVPLTSSFRRGRRAALSVPVPLTSSFTTGSPLSLSCDWLSPRVPVPLTSSFTPGTPLSLSCGRWRPGGSPSAFLARHLATRAALAQPVPVEAGGGKVGVGVMEVVEVELGARSYPIYIGAGILKGELLSRHISGKQVLIVTNETIAPLYLEQTVACLRAHGRPDLVVESVILPDGEEHKNLGVLNLIFDRAIETRMDRKCTMVALGGGVVGDMTGFAAASYLRGVNFIQVPTTVMAQVDSSVGGKTGVNHRLGKNLIGAFYQPQAVLIDTDTLTTLPDRELASGFAEVVKYGLIRDAPFFEWQEGNMERLMSRDPEALAYAIRRSCENKAEVVAADEKEGGLRATLNLGHTFGHAIENGLGYGQWLHGEAVAAGMVMAADLSQRLGWIDEELVQRARGLLERANLPIHPPPQVTKQQFKSLMAVDKKVADGQLRLILLKGPLGNCVFTGDFDPAALEATLDHFCTH